MSHAKRIVFISIAVVGVAFGLPARSQAQDPTPDPVVKELIDPLRTGNNPKDKRLAASWLGSMGDRSAIPTPISVALPATCWIRSSVGAAGRARETRSGRQRPLGVLDFHDSPFGEIGPYTTPASRARL